MSSGSVEFANVLLLLKVGCASSLTLLISVAEAWLKRFTWRRKLALAHMSRPTSFQRPHTTPRKTYTPLILARPYDPSLTIPYAPTTPQS